MGPFGEVVILSAAKRVVLRDTAGSLRRICKIAEEVRPRPNSGSRPKAEAERKPETPAKPPKEDKNEEESVDVLKYVYLTEITQTQQRKDALLYNRFTGKNTRLRVTPGFNTFSVIDENETKDLIRARVLSVAARDLFFQADDKVYRIHIGETLKEALVKPLEMSKVDKLGLKTVK
jgi:hypothetical protein